MVAALALTGNPSSVHGEGRRARAIVEEAREDVASLVDCEPSRVVFTSGATEANNWVMAQPWRTLATSEVEHDSVRAAVADRSARGVATIALPVNTDGLVAPLAVERIVPDLATPALVSVQLANSETGVIQPVADIARWVAARNWRVHCDATQAAGRIDISMSALGVDYLVLSAHKFGGPKGVGALVLGEGQEIASLLRGGGQELRRRAGTENVAAIAGMGAAARAAKGELAKVAMVARLRDRLEAAVREMTPGVRVVGCTQSRLANTSCLLVPGHAAETLVIRFDLAGVAISAGAACSSGKVGVSPALIAMGIARDDATTAIRVSIGGTTTDGEIEHFLSAWRAIVGDGRQHRAVA